jgi:hypothetical protein
VIKDQSISWVKAAGTVLVGGYFLQCALRPDDWHLIDNFDLIIHEAGHSIFAFFGDFIHVAAGSGFQVILPLIFVLYFYLYMKDNYSGSLLLTLVGYNLVNVSVYARDAIVMDLPLLGGDGVMHDWNYLLTMTHVLPQTYRIASLISGVGFLIIVIGIVLSFYFSRTETHDKSY